jgi:hypothetical protein
MAAHTASIDSKDNPMNRSIRSKILGALLAIAASGAANASTSLQVRVHLGASAPAPLYAAPAVHVQPQRVHGPAPVQVHPQPGYAPPPYMVPVPPRPVYGPPPGYGYGPGYGHGYGQGAQPDHDRGWRTACSANAWDPGLRYMPGQRVWRKGTVYVATRLSASVWNVNSPPEWTPNYWMPARCA